GDAIDVVVRSGSAGHADETEAIGQRRVGRRRRGIDVHATSFVGPRPGSSIASSVRCTTPIKYVSTGRNRRAMPPLPEAGVTVTAGRFSARPRPVASDPGQRWTAPGR